MISSTLLALATLLDVLICHQQERPGFDSITEPKHASKARVAAASYAEKLLTDHKYFLDFLKSQRPTIRSATYTVLKSLIKNIPQAINEGNLKTFAVAILGAFNEKDPTCHPSMWDVMLLFSRRFPGGWTSLNVQKSILNPFWNFLRSGCFGSQQVSYPALILFLDSVPPKAVAGAKFFLEFFKNLWAGRRTSLSADRLAFFQAFKECLLWSLKNASRYKFFLLIVVVLSVFGSIYSMFVCALTLQKKILCIPLLSVTNFSSVCIRYNDDSDSVSHFQVTLVDNVLVKLLWKDFLTTGSSKGSEIINSGKEADSSEENVSHSKKVDMLSTKSPKPHMQELGKCFVEILIGIYGLDSNLLSVFIVELEDNCMAILQQAGNVESVERIILFMLLLEQHAVVKGATWPLVYIVGPMLGKSFSIIRSSVS